MKEMFNKTLLSFHFELCQPGDFAIRFVWCDHWFEFRRAKDLYSTRFGWDGAREASWDVNEEAKRQLHKDNITTSVSSNL